MKRKLKQNIIEREKIVMFSKRVFMNKLCAVNPAVRDIREAFRKASRSEEKHTLMYPLLWCEAMQACLYYVANYYNPDVTEADPKESYLFLLWKHIESDEFLLDIEPANLAVVDVLNANLKSCDSGFVMSIDDMNLIRNVARAIYRSFVEWLMFVDINPNLD